MAASFSLEGRMIPRTVKRSIDERLEERVPVHCGTAVMEFRGRKHVVRLVNTSSSGAMVIFPLVPHIGEEFSLQMHDRGQVFAKVRWVRDGRIGISFDEPRE